MIHFILGYIPKVLSTYKFGNIFIKLKINMFIGVLTSFFIGVVDFLASAWGVFAPFFSTESELLSFVLITCTLNFLLAFYLQYKKHSIHFGQLIDNFIVLLVPSLLLYVLMIALLALKSISQTPILILSTRYLVEGLITAYLGMDFLTKIYELTNEKLPPPRVMKRFKDIEANGEYSKILFEPKKEDVVDADKDI